MLRYIILFFIFLPSFVYSQIEIKTVETTGRGTSKTLAIESALVEAVSQINGVEIAAKTKTKLSEVSSNNKTDIDESFNQEIEKKTGGLVKSYDILSSKKDGSFFVVKLSVIVPKYMLSKQTKRLRIAVVPFRVGSSDMLSNEIVNKFHLSLVTNIENYLTQTRKFALIDRSFLEEQTKELNLIKTEAGLSMQKDEIVKLGNIIATDHLVVGTIEKASSYVSEKKSKVSDTVKRTLNSNARVSIRIIDVATSQIKVAETFQKSITGSIEMVADILSSTIGDKILGTIYPIRILNASLTQVTLGQGGKTMENGDLFKVYQLGKKMKDVYTGESLGREEIEVATIQIKTIKPKTSEAQILESIVELSTALKDKDAFIVRPFKKAKAIKASSKPLKKPETIKNLKKESDDEW